jgi:hypothetical protein
MKQGGLSGVGALQNRVYVWGGSPVEICNIRSIARLAN